MTALGRVTRLTIRVVVAFALVIVGTACLFWVGLGRNIEGKWPFKPLTRHERTDTLANGGTLNVVQVENRDFGAEGGIINAYYTPPGGTTHESALFAGAIGKGDDVRAWSYGQVVVVLQPGSRRGISVRTPSGSWNSFDMEVPMSDDLRAGKTDFNYSRLTIDELRAIAAPVESLPPRHSGMLTVDDFSPATGELYLTYNSGYGHINRVRLRIEPDGSAFRLVSVVPYTGSMNGPIPPYRAK
jgi:hypothetical protein